MVILSCNRDNNHPGYVYTPDMAYSRAYEPFAENPLFADSNHMQPPINGTVPREMIPYQFKKTKEGRLKAGKYITNPIASSPEIVRQGKVLFEIVCQQCHGAKGDGKGKLFVDKLYPYPPASLISDKVKSAPDGEIFHVVSVGFNLMGSQASILTQEERWKVVHYVRELQKQSDGVDP
jgi:mono/diheme cytochrome c family protein